MFNRTFQDEINASNAIRQAESDAQRAAVVGRTGYTPYVAPRPAGPVSNINERQGRTTVDTPPSPAPAPNYGDTSNTAVAANRGPVAGRVGDDGGGGGGGGGGAAVATAVSEGPTSFFNLAEIRAALEAIHARFGFEREGLQGQRGSLGRALELLLGRLGKDQGNVLQENRARSSGSGRIRSGLFLRDQAQIVDTFADQIVRARAETDAKLSPIQLALGNLNARRDAEKAVEARAIGRQQMATQAEIARALELV